MIIGHQTTVSIIKRHFRVLKFKKGFITLYLSQMKTWFGWRSFLCYEDGGLIFDDSPRQTNTYALTNIENYRRLKGLDRDVISITEITK